MYILTVKVVDTVKHKEYSRV